MTDQTEGETDLNCEHMVRARDCPICFASLLRDLDSAAQGIQRLDRLDAESAARAIRGLEAKAAAAEAAVRDLEMQPILDGRAYAELRADRDRLAGEVEMYRREWHLMEVERDTLRDVRDRTCAEFARLTAELAAAREDAERYRWLREGGFNLPDLPYKRQSFAESVAELEAAIDANRLTPEEDDDE